MIIFGTLSFLIVSHTCLCPEVEVTKYEELEEAAAELKLKHLLWDSLQQWDLIVVDWMEVHTAA